MYKNYRTLQAAIASKIFLNGAKPCIYFKVQNFPSCINLQPSETRFSSWWCFALKNIPKEMNKGFNPLVIQVAWELWKHQNGCIFNCANPNVTVVLESVANESILWCSTRLQVQKGRLTWSFSPKSWSGRLDFKWTLCMQLLYTGVWVWVCFGRGHCGALCIFILSYWNKMKCSSPVFSRKKFA